MLLARHLAGLQQCARRRHVPGLVEIDLARRVESPAKQRQRAEEDHDAGERQSDRRSGEPPQTARRGDGFGGLAGGYGHGDG